jgi:DNA-binding MurR/RpiR family transcriptional regulator
MCSYITTYLHVHFILCITTLKKNRLIEQADEVLFATTEEDEVQSSKRYTNSDSKSNTVHVVNVHPYQL